MADVLRFNRPLSSDQMKEVEERLCNLAFATRFLQRVTGVGGDSDADNLAMSGMFSLLHNETERILEIHLSAR